MRMRESERQKKKKTKRKERAQHQIPDLGANSGEQEPLAEDMHRQEAHDVGEGERADLH